MNTASMNTLRDRHTVRMSTLEELAAMLRQINVDTEGLKHHAYLALYAEITEEGDRQRELAEETLGQMREHISECTSLSCSVEELYTTMYASFETTFKPDDQEIVNTIVEAVTAARLIVRDQLKAITRLKADETDSLGEKVLGMFEAIRAAFENVNMLRTLFDITVVGNCDSQKRGRDALNDALALSKIEVSDELLVTLMTFDVNDNLDRKDETSLGDELGELMDMFLSIIK